MTKSVSQGMTYTRLMCTTERVQCSALYSWKEIVKPIDVRVAHRDRDRERAGGPARRIGAPDRPGGTAVKCYAREAPE